MTDDILIQLLGGAGYALLVAATQMRSRAAFLVLDFIGLVPVVIHYWLLGAIPGAVLSAAYMATDLAAAFLERGRTAQRFYFAFYPLVLALTAVTYETPTDLLAMAGSMLAVAARQQLRLFRLQVLICASAVGWGLYGVAAWSIGQMTFSTFYAIASAYAAWRLWQDAQSTERKEPPR